MNQPLLSVITPTYNRASLLNNCFESLRSQTDQDFEWIIVDDGSTDDTELVVQSFSAAFPICSVKKENGGKHTALNASHEYVHGKYVLILDSDDRLVSSAVEQIRAGWKRFEADRSVGIVTFLKGISLDKPTCTAPDEGVPVDIMRYKRRCIYSSDCCEVIRAELFLQYPFPVFQNETFLSEGALWNRVSFTHKCVYINQVIYLCEYHADGLTRAGRRLRIANPLGGMYTAKLNMDRKNYFSRRIKNGLLYTCYGLFAGETAANMVSQCDDKILVCVCLPFGWILKCYWQMKYKK